MKDARFPQNQREKTATLLAEIQRLKSQKYTTFSLIKIKGVLLLRVTLVTYVALDLQRAQTWTD